MKQAKQATKPKKATTAGYKKPAATRKYAGTTTSLDPFLKAIVAGRSAVKRK